MADDFANFALPPVVPPSIAGNFDPGDDVTLTRVKNAMVRMADASAKALEIARSELGNDMIMPAERHRRVRDASHRTLKPAFEGLDRATEDLGKEIAKLKELTSGPPANRDPRTEIRYGNLLDGLRALPQPERLKAILSTLKSGNDEIIAAVLAYPPIVAGLDQREMDLVRRGWAEQKHPLELERLTALRAAEGHLARAGSLASKFATSLYSVRLLEAAVKRAGAAEAAIAAGAA